MNVFFQVQILTDWFTKVSYVHPLRRENWNDQLQQSIPPLISVRLIPLNRFFKAFSLVLSLLIACIVNNLLPCSEYRGKRVGFDFLPPIYHSYSKLCLWTPTLLLHIYTYSSFTSHLPNINPPFQALFWSLDGYKHTFARKGPEHCKWLQILFQLPGK